MNLEGSLMAMAGTSEKPRQLHEYKAWLNSGQNLRIDSVTETHYRTVADRIRVELAASPFWREWLGNMKLFQDTYFVETGYLLLMPNRDPELLTKPFESALLKSFRQNVLRNDRWPDEPIGGWVLPTNWFSKINDIARTVVAVKYLDGVKFLGEQTMALAARLGLESRIDFEAKEEGYYAGHLYVYQDVEVPRLTWDMERAHVSFEIQITTQLQEVIRLLLHKYYEERRGGPESDTKWQWDYGSDQFVANYLGHILHYVEGMIMDVRGRQGGGSK
jgi:hypothetical protein